MELMGFMGVARKRPKFIRRMTRFAKGAVSTHFGWLSRPRRPPPRSAAA